MLIKYGKPVEMRSVNRNLDTIKKAIEYDHRSSDKYYKEPIKGSKPKCRICGSEQVDLFVQLWGKYDYYQCRECVSVFLYNLPNVEQMYSGEESTVNGTLYIDDEVYKQRVEMISGPKVKFVLEVCEQMKCQVSQWLDVGCGGGEILSFLEQNTNIKAVGIESDRAECEFIINKGMEVHNLYIDVTQDNEQINTLIKESDVISFINVIEHIENPVQFISYVYERMKVGSILVFEVPRHPSVASFANQTCTCAAYRHIVAPIHLQVFSEKALDYLLGSKYEILGKWEFGQGYTDLINNAMILSGNEESPLYIELMNMHNKIQPIFDEAGLADQMLIVARKR